MKKYTVHFNSGNQHDYPSIVVNVVGGMATPEDARRVQEILDANTSPAKQAASEPHPYAGKRKGHPDGDFSYRCGSDYCRCAQ